MLQITTQGEVWAMCMQALLAAVPGYTIDAWIACKPPLDARRLLPALMNACEATQDSHMQLYALHFVEHCISQLQSTDTTLHNLAVRQLYLESHLQNGQQASPGCFCLLLALVTACTASKDSQLQSYALCIVNLSISQLQSINTTLQILAVRNLLPQDNFPDGTRISSLSTACLLLYRPSPLCRNLSPQQSRLSCVTPCLDSFSGCTGAPVHRALIWTLRQQGCHCVQLSLYSQDRYEQRLLLMLCSHSCATLHLIFKTMALITSQCADESVQPRWG